MYAARSSTGRKRCWCRITAASARYRRPAREVLPHVVDAVSDRCEVYVDGGIWRGERRAQSDRAWRARTVLVGRAVLWGLCVAGEEGAVQVLEILRRELDEAMLLCGCTKLSDIDGSLLKL